MAPSPFLSPGPTSQPNSLALLALRRDQLTAINLKDSPDAVTNTRFGSFPHKTLTNVPWGTQVRAYTVHGGHAKGSKKRKRAAGKESGHGKGEANGTGENEEDDDDIEAAATGFAHLVPPTPEAWTVSLPHRTQVVYTPDYSYVLQRLKVRPGDCLVEAGSGSGSFTHAAARAVFNGYGSQAFEGNEMGEKEGDGEDVGRRRKRKKYGHVYSFEYHEPRAKCLQKEIKEHGLEDVVTVTNRDVYEDGFCVEGAEEPKANAVFLDLPAPWMALKHLSRSPPEKLDLSIDQQNGDARTWRSPLDPRRTVYLCTFSPCIEQVQRTVEAMRQLGWVDIAMTELLHKRIDVRRERVGLQEEGLRGVNANPATVEEAIERLREVEARTSRFFEAQKESKSSKGAKEEADPLKAEVKHEATRMKPLSKKQRLDTIKEQVKERKIWKEGRLVHRTEPEMKTHTSYLVFAVLPRSWTQEDEENAAREWPTNVEAKKGGKPPEGGSEGNVTGVKAQQ
ncbi:hypothetical protein LTS18_006392 [Coniosporium uncinatum]|uniref:Uncharacterized protein n=1 Tax=Coniosporium uncinatum TaxID=93489 RepID=A0ACC3DQF2_9PEZI|nr:hypothetical protein LTS18_006392 [Coniosporium uncinatum]